MPFTLSLPVKSFWFTSRPSLVMESGRPNRSGTAATAKHAPIRSRRLGRWRAAVPSAPIIDPTPISEVNAP